MTSIYPFAGASGPWACDDTAVSLDGYLLPAGLATGTSPTLDGVEAVRASGQDEAHSWLVNTKTRHLAHAHDDDRGPR